MVERLSNYSMTIIFTAMMVIIIKMIAPEGKNKKYIIFVCGLITTIVIIEPILHLMDINVNEVFAEKEEEYQQYKIDETLYQNAIKESYEDILIKDITNRLNENGYKASHIRIEYDEDTYKPLKIYLHIEDGVGYVQPIKIEVSKENTTTFISEVTRNNVQEILKSNYGIEKNNIWIEGSNQ